MAVAAAAASLVDVVVVGAGLAGMTAAWKLADAGHSIAVLEARARTGGRLVNGNSSVTPGWGDDGATDLGAAWVWPSNDRALLALAQELGVPLFAQSPPAMGATAANVVVQGAGGSVELQRGQVFGEERRVEGGTCRLVDALREALPKDRATLKTECQVTSIAQKQAGEMTCVRYRCGDETVQEVCGRRVVVAAPPRLVAARIAFDPPLPARKRQAMERTATWMSDTAKAVLLFRRPFWREQGLSGNAFSQRGPLSQVWDNVQDQSKTAPLRPALAGFVLGEAATALRRLPPDAQRERVVGQIAALFGDAAREELVDARLHFWEDEEWTHTEEGGGDGATLPAGHPAVRSVHGHIHFAGTETEPEHGHMEGAVRSGLRAAREVADAIATPAGPQHAGRDDL